MNTCGDEEITPCEFSTRTENCACCKKEVKKGFLFGWGIFVCSEKCANDWENKDE